MKNVSDKEESAMRQALALAAKGRGAVEPNPMVGCVLLKRGKVIGQGAHRRFGGAHAEVNAIRSAGAAARGSTMLVTLEPCTHHGKTPPCTDAIVRAGVRKVVYAMRDPNPATGGRARGILQRAGIEVAAGSCAADARKLNAPYIKLTTTGMPYVTAKWAMTLDGKIASRLGDAKWISSARSRQIGHRMRAFADAVLVGIQTVLVDDPLLTCRIPNGTNPLRVVLDSHARLPLRSRLVRSIGTAETLLITTAAASKRKRLALEKAGCHILVARKSRGGVDFVSAMEQLGRLQVTNLLIEGGGGVLGSAFDRGLVDRVAVFIAARILGGRTAPTPHEGRGVDAVGRSLQLADVQTTSLGDNFLIEGKIKSAKR